METKEYVIKGDGNLIRRVVSETSVMITDALVNAITEGSVIKKRNIMEVAPGVMAHGAFLNSNTMWSVEINAIPLKAPFKLVDKVLVPNFNGEEPVLELTWTAPATMRLRFCVWVAGFSDGYWRSDYQYLVAYDERGQSWKLPLGNLYEDCRLCLGRFQTGFPYALGKTHMELINVCLRQFANGQWNADLWTCVAETQSMFRFKAKDTGFDVLPVKGDRWEKLCTKVSTDMLKNIIL